MLSRTSYGASLEFTWNANVEEDLAGYKIYYGTEPGNYGEPVDAGPVTHYELKELNEGSTYYIAITAYDSSRNESNKSEEVTGKAHQPPTDTTLRKFVPVSVTASSEFLPFWVKANILDSDPLTPWSTAPSLFWRNEFITLDLGEVKKISRIEMYSSEFFNLDLFPVNFKIQISDDNTTWQDIRTEENYAAQSESWDFSGSDAHYIRIYITKGKPFFILFSLAQIAEIEVYGYDTPEQSLTSADGKSAKDTTPEDTVRQKIATPAERFPGEPLEPGAPGIPGTPGRPQITFNK